MPSTLAGDLALLTDPKSTQRRAAAKRLRKLADPMAGPPLLDAFRKEITDPRSWQNQYQLAMALGACEYAPATPALQAYAQTDLESTTVYLGLGDAIVRCGRSTPNDPTPLLWCLDRHDNKLLVRGALQAVALLDMVPPDDVIQRVLEMTSATHREDRQRIFVAAASVNWSNHPLTRPFLLECLKSPERQIQETAQDSLKGKRTTYRPA